MVTVIDNRTLIDQTIKIYDNFYNLSLTINSAQYDVVYSFFRGITDSDTIAKNFTAFMFRIAQEVGIDVLELLQQLKTIGGDKIKVNKVIAYYLNSLKSKTSLYGTSMVPAPNIPVARNVIY